MMTKQHDEGFTLIELLLVIVVLGILSAVVVYSVLGITGEGQASACEADANVLSTSVEAFFAQTGSRDIVAADASPDGFEKTLVAEGFLRSPSTLIDINSLGALEQMTDSPCTV